MRREVQFSFVVFVCLMALGCSKLFNGFRSDEEDRSSPPESTTGGRWAEKEYLRGEPKNSHFREDTPYAKRNLASTPAVPEDEPQAELAPNAQTLNRPSPLPPRVPRVTREDFIDRSQEEGSLWASNGQVNYYFTKNKVRSPGDIISITLENDLFKDIGAEIKHTLSEEERNKELRSSKSKFENSHSDQGAAPPLTERGVASNSSTASPNPKPTATSVNKSATWNEDFDIFSSIDVKLGDVMMGEIVERFSNGHYKIRGIKRIPYKMGPSKMVSVMGIVRTVDINEETDSINSGKLYEYRVQVAQ